MKKAIFLICFVVVLLINPLQGFCATFCVTSESELLSALYDAANNSEDDLIKIAQGTYSGSFVYSSGNGFNLTIEGGYNSDCSSRSTDPLTTVLDGGKSQRVMGLLSTDEFQSADFQVDGLTFQNGNWPVTGTGGGGLFVSTQGGSVSVTRCIARNNICGNLGGGGILITPFTGDVTISETTLSDNETNNGGFGGGVHVKVAGRVIIENNIVSGNITSSGGGISVSGGDVITITDNHITGNSAGIGGGVYLTGGEITIDSNLVSGSTRGGGIFIAYISGGHTAQIINNTILDNQRCSGVRVMSLDYDDTCYIVNNVIAGNESTSPSYGGGVDFGIMRGRTVLTNNTIAGNITSGNGGGVKINVSNDDGIVQLYSNIIRGNTASLLGDDVYINTDGNDNLIYSPIQIYNNDFNLALAGFFIADPTYYTRIDPSNLDNVDPLFTDVGNANFHLREGSPCINTGNNQAPEMLTLDRDGQPRIMDGSVDMGAFEVSGPVLPVVLFNSSVQSGSAPLAVNFYDESLGSIDAWLWEFGDGSTSAEQNPVHTYSSVGVYSVKLTVTGAEGEGTETRDGFIVVDMRVPVANTGPDRAVSQFLIILDGSGSSDGDGSVVAYQWDLVHRVNPVYNISATGSAPHISGLNAGYYDVTLTVTDNDGLTGSDTMELAVTEPWDIDNDGQTGLAEAVFILQTLTGLRQ